jgi:RimJ/RimL family protein N-acetyltransferase
MGGIEIVTERLHLRSTCSDDLASVTALGADERVMTSLSGVLTADQCVGWLERQVRQWRVNGLGPFVVEREGVFVGFVGLSSTDFEAGLVPAVEVAWRIAFDHWGKGYATEAARAVIEDAFERLGLSEVAAVTTPQNTRSRRVMDRLGMVYSPAETFEHPRVPEGSPLRTHVVYRLPRENWSLPR